MKWCHPHSYGIDVKNWAAGSNLLSLLPCGFVYDNTKHNEYFVRWIMTVNVQFYINVTFLRFEIRDSGEDCSLSALKIGAFQRGGWRSKWYWSYCGYRPPWSETILSNKAVMTINQNNINYRFNVSFMYYIIEHDDYLGSELYYADIIPTRQQDVYYHIEHMHYIKWIVQLKLGYVAHFSTIQLFNFVGQFDIYDGPTKRYGIFSRKQIIHDTFDADVNTTTAYFTAAIHLMPHRSNKEFSNHQVMQLSFEKKKRDVGTLLTVNSRIPIQNRGKILHAVYSVSGAGGHYPNITFGIRRFDGWNEGGCNMGGFALVQQLSDDDKTLITSGPYCPGGGSNQPLITDEGPDFIILGKKVTLLVIYAFGPEYWVDIDVVVSVSLCEGSFDFPLLCQAELDISDHMLVTMHWDSFQLNCQRVNKYSASYISMRMLKVTGCVITQVMIHQKVISYQMELLSRMDVNFDYSSPVHRNYAGNVTYFSAIYLFLGNTKTGTQHTMVLDSNDTLDIGDVTWLTYAHQVNVPYHESSVTIVMLQVDKQSGVVKEQCELINQSAIQQHAQQLDVEDIRLSSLCATGYYQKARAYVYTIVPSYLTDHRSLSNVYLNVQELKCVDMMNVWSSLTVTVRTTFSQSFHITNSETMEIEVPNVSIVMVLEKQEDCSTMIFQYRVYLMVLHNALMKSLFENIFQVYYDN